jgi:CRISPR-associated protein Csm1
MEDQIANIAKTGLFRDLSKVDSRFVEFLPNSNKFEDILELAERFSVGEAERVDQKTFPESLPQAGSVLSQINFVDENKPGVTLATSFFPLKELFVGENDFPLPFPEENFSQGQLAEGLINSIYERVKKIHTGPAIYIEKCLATLQRFAWCLSAPGFSSQQAINLYDHSRIMAALAVCLEEAGEEQRKQWLQGTDLEKQVCTLVGGDISGIQDFIYTISSKGATSALRGRSLYLQFLTDAVVRAMLKETGLPVTNLIFAGGGHFYLLAREKDQNNLIKFQAKVSKCLLNAHNGDLYLAIASEPLYANTLKGTSLSGQWKKLSDKLFNAKMRKFTELGPALFTLLFEPRHDQGNLERECVVCGREHPGTGPTRQSLEAGTEIRKCPLCVDFENLGKDLRKAHYLVVQEYGQANNSTGDRPWNVDDILTELGFRYSLCSDPDEVVNLAASENTLVYALDEPGLKQEKLYPLIIGRKYLVNVTPIIASQEEFDQLRKDGVKDLPEEKEFRKYSMVKPFSALEQHSRSGFKRLGVLRMDVDDMGRIISEGLGDRANLVNQASISMLVNLYFEGITTELAKAYNQSNHNPYGVDHVYSIYAGGDDLFFVGSWDVMPRLALDIRNTLRKFVSHNPSIHISAGIALIDAKYPLYKAAEDGHKALELSKRRPRKNSITFLGQSMDWDTFEKDVLPDVEKLADFVSKGRLPRQVLQRLMGFQLQYEKKKRDVLAVGEELNKSGQVQTLWGPWNWHSSYFLKRLKLGDDAKEVRDFIDGVVNKLEGENFGEIEWIGLAARWADLLSRGE